MFLLIIIMMIDAKGIDLTGGGRDWTIPRVYRHRHHLLSSIVAVVESIESFLNEGTSKSTVAKICNIYA